LGAVIWAALLALLGWLAGWLGFLAFLAGWLLGLGALVLRTLERRRTDVVAVSPPEPM
jgi:hypothetical protein